MRNYQVFRESKMKSKVLLTALLLTAGTAHSAAIEVWECSDIVRPSSEIIAETRVNEGRKTGEIAVAGVTHKTAFEVAGFERRWDFGLRKDGSYKYAFIITPDGHARYFDFVGSKAAKPSILMNCRQRTPASSDN
jgi:hypothetical protein